MQYDPNTSPPPIRPRPARPRLIGMNNREQDQYTTPKAEKGTVTPPSFPAQFNDVTMQPTVSMESMQTRTRASIPGTPPNYFKAGLHTDDISNQSTSRLMQLSGMMPAVRIPTQNGQGSLPVAPARLFRSRRALEAVPESRRQSQYLQSHPTLPGVHLPEFLAAHTRR